MRRVALLSALLSLLLIPSLLPAQIGPDGKGGSTPTVARANAEGTKFVVGFMKNEESTSYCQEIVYLRQSNQRIIITSRYQTEVRVAMPDGSQRLFNIAPFEVRTIILNETVWVDTAKIECLGEVCANTYAITSEKPINVYCFSSKRHTSDGYLALPVETWGTEYVTANFGLDHYNLPRPPGFNDRLDSCSLEPRGGQFAVIASEDFTSVEITPATRTREGYPAGIPVRRVLMAGEMWRLEDGGTVRGGSDITGSRVSADKPVGLLSGHVRTGIPVSMSTKDHLIEMLAPIEDLGRRHIVVPFGGRQGGDVVRIISTSNNRTNIVVSTSTGRYGYTIAGFGSFQEIVVSDVSVIETSEDVVVAHYSQSNGIDPDGNFDPYMVMVTPEEQFATSAVFQTMSNNGDQFVNHFVTLVVEEDSIQTVLVNGRPLSNLNIIGSGQVPTLEGTYRWVTAVVPDDAAFVIDGFAKFGGYVYGIGEWDSYGWPVGTGNVPPVRDTIPPDLTAEPECGGLFWEITATDTVPDDTGLRGLQLDQTQSTNVRVVGGSPTPWPAGAIYPIATLRVRLIDPTLPGRAVVVAWDNGGINPGEFNFDTLAIDIEMTLPSFDRDSILIAGARKNTVYRDLMRILNENTEGFFTIDSLRLVDGRHFKIDGHGDFQLLGRSLDVGGSQAIGFTFYATETGIYRDTLVVWIDCLPYRIPLTALMASPAIATEDVDYGTLRAGADSCKDVVVRNTGTETLCITDIRVAPGSDFGFSPGAIPDLPICIEPGQERTVVICFRPNAAGDYPGTVTFLSNAASGDSVANLVGRAVVPGLDVRGYDFGELHIGDTACAPIPVVNTGEVPIRVTGLRYLDNNPQIYLEDRGVFPADIAPGDTLWVPVCFVPRQERDYPIAFGADNDEGLEAVANLDGSGYHLLAEIDGYDWGQRRVGTQHDQVITMRNLKRHTITVDSIWLAGGDAGDFTILTPIPPAVTIDPGEDYPLTVRFSPLAIGDRSIGIFARTDSRLEPIISNVLEGFAVEPIPGDELLHDESVMFACDERTSRVLLYNRGNVPLTLAGVTLDSPDGRVTLNAPAAGSVIPVGDVPLEIEMTFVPNGFVGRSSATVSWSFEEFPDATYDRTVGFSTLDQSYEIVATAPPQIDNSERFDLFVGIGNPAIEDRKHGEVIVEIRFNRRVTLFDMERYNEILRDQTTDWQFVGTPERIDSTGIRFLLRPSGTDPLPLDGVTLPGFPFRGYLGNEQSDTFRIDMIIDRELCTRPAMTSLPYSLAEICGLSSRLFEVAGDPPALRQSRPNPATAQSAVDFTIPFEGPVSIDLYTAEGVLVEHLVDGALPAGDHELTIDLDDLPSGVYYYRMSFYNYVATRALVVRR